MQVRRDLNASGFTLNVPNRLQVDAAPLGHVDAAMRLQAVMGDGWTADMFERLAELYPAGVPEDELTEASDRLLGNEVEVARHLRAVK
jgi:hypothetical protein